ncbi:MAG: DUF2314 domain-containing protein [Pedobacter sp.]|nr:MAG: DUF2314 domain-containing protein [Pedobacter sp.]
MKNLLRGTLSVFIAICILNCNSNNKVERKNEPTIYSVDEDDAEMNKAMKTAKQTLDSFNYALKNNTRIFTFFGLKKRFVENDDVEHIWIGNVKFENGKYFGVIDNLPEKIKDVKIGDTVEIGKSEISDWMYIKNSQLHGGYTIRLLRNRMSELERKKFDRESGMKIN